MATKNRSTRRAALMLVLSVSVTGLLAQTVVKPPKNRYTPQQDVELGREAAAEIREQYPVIEDERIARYLTRLGDRLVAVAPPELKQSVYEYSFTPVNLKEINAFALPGGPMFVHRGMFDAAAAEGEVVGVMAHELSHVLLRHGTANASKAQNPWLQLGQIAGVVGGAVVGGAAGSAIAQGSQFGLGTLLLRYSRDFEKQADLLGAQIMARAGYDPRALARMFETIERESKSSGGSGPQWMSSHPNPGNRTQYITKEAEPADDRERRRRQRVRSRSRPRSRRCRRRSRWAIWRSEERRQAAKRLNRSEPPGSLSRDRRRSIGTVNGGGVFQAAVPSNWTSLSSNSAIKVVPAERLRSTRTDRRSSATASSSASRRPGSRDLQEATNAWLKAVAQNNPELRLAGPQQALRISQRSAIATPLVNPSPLGGQERIGVYTTFLVDGSLFYYLTIVPENDAAAFQETFQRVGESIRLTERR